jgi:hypothetical protein
MKFDYNAAKDEAKRTANALRNTKIDEVRANIADRAGWSKVPKNQQELNQELGAVGKKYGDALNEHTIPMTSFSKDVAGLAETPGLHPNEASRFTRLSDQLTALQDRHGGVPGEMYRTIRSELNQAKGAATGTFKDHLQMSLDTLDDLLKRETGPDKFAKIVKMRDQYALGSKINKESLGGGETFSPTKLSKTLNDVNFGTDPTGAQTYLNEVIPALPEKVSRSEASAAIPKPSYPMKPDLEPLYKTPLEQKKLLKAGVVAGLLAKGTAGASLAAAPAMYALRAAANNETTRNTMSRLLRGFTQNVIN